MNFIKYDPEQSLRTFIKNYYSIKSSKSENIHFNHPQGCIDIVFIIKGEMTFHKSTGKESFKDIVLIPQQTSYFKVDLSDSCQIIGLTFKPEFFSFFFSLESYEFKNKCISVSDYSRNLLELREKLVEKPDRFQTLFDQFFYSGLCRHGSLNMNFSRFLNEVRTYHGNLSVSGMSDLLNVSNRTLERRFRENIGISPKQYSKILRLNYAIKSINSRVITNFSELSYEYGYYDQMHFIKEFKLFTGQTPKKFFSVNQDLASFFLG